jgi:hypothetical protein
MMAEKAGGFVEDIQEGKTDKNGKDQPTETE